MGIGCTVLRNSMPPSGEEASALMITDVALADLEVTLADKLGLNLINPA